MRKGISDEQIDYLCKTIEEYREKISQNQTQIEDLLLLIKENFQNDSLQDLTNMIEQIKVNKDAVNNNLLGYIENLKKLQRSYIIQDETISANLKRDMEKIKEE